MTQTLPGVFAGIISEDDPAPQASPCGAPKVKQTNAIIYRVGRFEPVGAKHTWQSWAMINGSCKRNNQARSINVMQKFKDKLTQRHVTVASLHWSTKQEAGLPDPACAHKNVVEADQKLNMPGFGGDLVIFGGDMNETDLNTSLGYRAWYKEVNGDIGGAFPARTPSPTTKRTPRRRPSPEAAQA